MPIKLGRKIQVWNIEIKNEDEKMVAVSRLTLAVIDK
jgi:1,4-dihydroxy-2-naphthoyl-CoA hydrolase